MQIEPPLPPEEMRALVGTTDPTWFDNPTGENAVPQAGERAYGEVLDFGCGCGRMARRLMQQQPPPRRYVGIDLHAGMIRWCSENLAPLASQFSFFHHDVYNAGLNPASSHEVLPFPVEDASFDLVTAHSVFTHVVEDGALHYLKECARALRPGGALVATWFLFDKQLFPMMQPFQNALYINDNDPTNAVIYDRAWLRTVAGEAGLRMTEAWPPWVRGFQWVIRFEAAAEGLDSIELPADTAPLGSVPPPVPRVPAYTIGA